MSSKPVTCPLCNERLDVADRPTHPSTTVAALAVHFETQCKAVESTLPRRAQ